MGKNLSLPQKNMYETEQFFAGTGMCNIGGLVIFKEENINITTLEKAVNKAIEINRAIRAKIVMEEQVPCQEILDYSYEKIEFIQLNEKEYRFVMETWTAEPLDIYQKMYAFKIVKLGNKTGVYLKFHHIVSDAWSILLFGAKIVDYYYKLFYHITISPDDMPQYDAYFEKEQEYLSSKRYQADEEFWKKKYETKPSFVTMSPHKKSDQDVRARRISYHVSTKETEAILKYCEEHKISSAILLEAITALYATRINGVDDVTLCSLVINRTGNEEKNTIGMFNNILPLTIHIDGNESFANLCQKVSEEHYEVYRHQKYPLANILNIIREKHGKDTALYDIMVSYQNGRLPDEISQKAETDWIFNGTSDLGFMLNISDRNNDGRIRFDFDARLNCFTEEEIHQICNRLIGMVNQVVVTQDILCKDVEIVTYQEKEQILTEFNNTLKPYENHKCLQEFLEEYAKKYPDKIALRMEGKEMTYREFNEKANCLAHYILSIEKRRNAIIGVMTERSFEMLIAIYAILKSGNAYMPIDVNFPADRIQFMLEDSEAKMVLTQEKWMEKIHSPVIGVNLNAFSYDAYENTNPKTTAVPTDIAYVIYTSGSTGKPKGAMLYHHSVVNRIQWMHEKYPLQEGDVILQKTPYTFDVSVWELFWWSMYHQTLQILIPEGHKDPAEIIACIKKGNVTHIHFVPSMLNAFLEYLEVNPQAVKKLTSLRYVFASGEALQVEHVKRFYQLLGVNGTTLHNLYGPTECTVDVSYYDCNPNHIPKSIPIGKPIDNTQLLVLDKYRKLLPVGIVGELYISGVLVGKGYLKREELTNEKFVPNLYYQYSKMYQTGDLAMWLPDGNIEYLGRTDFQVKIRGLRIELGDIENAILKIPGIKQCVVNSFESNGDQKLCAYFTAKENMNEELIRRTLHNELPNYMVPNYYLQLDHIPLNANGKADRKALPIPQLETGESVYVGPKNEVEKQVQICVQEVLKRSPISCEVNLFDCGLSSLGVISIITKLSALGYELKVKDFYESQSISEIAELLQRKNIPLEDYDDDRQNYSDISDISQHLLPQKEEGAILLTGATGFLGIHLLAEIIEQTDKKVYCLIRNEDKFYHYLKEYTNLKKNNDRIILVKGDITQENLGIEETLLNEIKINVSDIIHSAANVTFFCSWDSIKKTNYEGTCQVLKFAMDSHAKLHHISTMSVSGDILTHQTKDRPDFCEKDLYIGQMYKENVYSYSKYLAEKEIIRAIRENKVNASIYRIANLTWRALDYRFQENYQTNDLYIITKVLHKYHKIPLELVNEDLVLTPVDDCARAIVKLMNVKENRVYHLFSEYSLNMVKYMKAIMIPDVITIKELSNILSQNAGLDAEDNFVFMYISGIVNNASSSIVTVYHDETTKILRELGFQWHELDEKYVQSILKKM